MQTVTDIKTQLKNPNKVSIFLDSKYAFSLTIAQLTDFPELKLNAELTASQVKGFKKLSSFTNLYLNLLNLIYRRPRSEKEIRDKLRLKKLEPEETEDLIAKLKSQNHLNDTNFATWWVQSRKSSKPISSLKLKAELAQKGIAADIISTVLEQEFNSTDELNSLLNLISKKRDKYSDEGKLIAYLASKGFKYSDIKNALSNLEPTENW